MPARCPAGSCARRLANYVQRYATKNDTIGFFGPTAWARFDPGHPGPAVRRGSGEIVSRHSHFEVWAVDLLAREWEADPELRSGLPPWLDPSTRLDGRTPSRPSGLTTSLTGHQAVMAPRLRRQTDKGLAHHRLPGRSTQRAWGILNSVTCSGRPILVR